jgi:hypothetical protein
MTFSGVAFLFIQHAFVIRLIETQDDTSTRQANQSASKDVR